VNDAERFKLLFGPYRTPRFRYGATVECLCRGPVTIVGITDSKIPWPVGRTKRAKSLVVYRGLADAIRRESNQAVAHWWGVTAQTVTKWRKILGVDVTNTGTSRLRADHAREEPIAAGRRKAWAKARDPERRRKIAEARRGKKRPPHVAAMLRTANVGRTASAESRAKMSVAQKRRGVVPPKAGRLWTPDEDELVRSLPAVEAAGRTGRTLTAIYMRRRELRVADGRRR